MKKTFDLKSMLPVGWDDKATADSLVLLHLGSVLSILAFLWKYLNARADLYIQIPGSVNFYSFDLDPTRTIVPFRELISGGPLLGCWCFLVINVIQVWSHYRYHFQDSMSIYTMRRLPDRWELHRRCWTQPVLSALTELLIFMVLTVLCAMLYYFATPVPCRPW